MKMTPLVLVPLVLLSCHGPSSSGKTTDSVNIHVTPDSAKSSSTTSSNGIDSLRKPLADTPSTPMIAQNWGGVWKFQEHFGGGELKITGIGKKTFSFSIEANDGGGSGELEGAARLKGYHALYTNKDEFDACTIEFTFSGDSIYVDQQAGNCGAGAGVYYSGYYYKHPPRLPEATLISLGIFSTEAQDKKFRALVGDDYKLFTGSSQMTFQAEKDTENLHALVQQAAVKHEFSSRANIILITDNLDIWAAVINEDSVNYYTNRADYKHRLPRTIEDWRENFSEKPIVYK